MREMRALVRCDDGVRVERRRAPSPGPGEVRVRVRLAGVCRTDQDVASGRLPVTTPRILGHELCGTVDGIRVAVDPILPCGQCARCREGGGAGGVCARPRQLGVDLDGAFAEFVVVPRAAVHSLPGGLSDHEAAYAEPVAAAMAPLRVGLSARARGLVLGASRVALLAERVLRLHGFRDLTRVAADPEPDAFDFAVETDPRDLGAALTAVRPGGTVVLKSRPSRPVAMDLTTAVRKELRLVGAWYAPFPEAVAVLAARRLRLDDLFGETRALEDFADLPPDGARKTFLDPAAVADRPPARRASAAVGRASAGVR